MPAQTAKLGKNLVIVNLQKTPLDDLACLRINAMCDDVMNRVMEKLKLTIP
jgi:NAD+-dependent protein deacetylase SIR2